ncbi:Protein ORF31 [Trichinella pseudospiralis]
MLRCTGRIFISSLRTFLQYELPITLTIQSSLLPSVGETDFLLALLIAISFRCLPYSVKEHRLFKLICSTYWDLRL